MPRVDDAGTAALDDVTAGVKAAVATGIVDERRLGLLGYSYGAYETNFIITATPLFKAAVAWAGASSNLTFCDGMEGDRPMSRFCESDQPFLSGPWWKNWDAYMRTSPLYRAGAIETPLLLLHGTCDPGIKVSEAIALFNTMRRMNKPVVLVEYKDQEHVFTQAAMPDVEDRITSFLGHLLKDAPAPGWWTGETAKAR